MTTLGGTEFLARAAGLSREGLQEKMHSHF